jgi:chemotaxis protein MotB
MAVYDRPGARSRPARGRGLVRLVPARGEKDESEVRWLTSYSDFMMQLVCLFILLYSVSTLDPGRTTAATYRGDEFGSEPASASGGRDGRFPALRPELAAALRQVRAALGRYPEGRLIRISPTDDGFRLGLTGEMFEEGSSLPTRDGARLLDVAALLLNPLQPRASSIEVVGHASAGPVDREEGSALKRSLSRALEAMRRVSRPDLSRRLDPALLRPAGRGAHEPAADGGAPSTRALNRRVEFLVHLDREGPPATRPRAQDR